jgi:hypothetical protein
MADINDVQTKLNYLDETKQLIKNAITEKGQDIEDDDAFREYVEKIQDIKTSSNFVMSGVGIEPKKVSDYKIGDIITYGDAIDSDINIDDYTFAVLYSNIPMENGTNGSDVYQFITGNLILKITNITNEGTTKMVSGQVIKIFETSYPIYSSTSINYGDKEWFNYEWSKLNTESDKVLNTCNFIGPEGITQGNMSNNGNLIYTPSDEEQEIPEGYTSGGMVLPMDITNSEAYDRCLSISKNILGIE